MSIKIWIRKNKIRWAKKKIIMFAVVAASGSLCLPYGQAVKAESCPDLKIVFARGSGAERWGNDDYKEFKARIEEKLPTSGLSYEFIDLDYPAVGVGMDNLITTAGALVGSGDAFEFGESVNAGVQELRNVTNSCKNTKYVLGGYSQGAMAVSKALPSINADKIIYAATFGDPKIYLPEGEGIIPAACRGDNLSDYRMYVPDCRAYKGLLGAYIPYEPALYGGKVGTWCNRHDIFCSSYINVNDHVSYVSDNLYEDASRLIVSKITKAFDIKNEYTSPHDTAILIDSTGSMSWLINQFKEEAVRLANETFEAGGRVALYDYRDLRDPYEPVARCDFETCTAENFRSYLDEIVVDGGGDEPESMLSASFKTMSELKWRRGATKSLVVLTDAPFLSPDADKTTVDDVVKLSKEIDPVNIYIITDYSVAGEHPEMATLADATGGALTTELGALNLLTDYIMERYDTLPQVEEVLDDSGMPTLEIIDKVDDGESITVKFGGKNVGVIVIMNDTPLGIVYGDTVELKDIDRSLVNHLILIPINDSRKGESIEIELPIVETGIKTVSSNPATTEKNPALKTTELKEVINEILNLLELDKKAEDPENNITIPKVPDTSVAK